MGQSGWKSESSVRALQAIAVPLKDQKSKSSFSSAASPEATVRLKAESDRVPAAEMKVAVNTFTVPPKKAHISEIT